MRSKVKRRHWRGELRKWSSDVCNMDAVSLKYSTTSSSCKSNCVSKLERQHTCRRSLVTCSSCKCKRMLFKKAIIAVEMALSLRCTAAVLLPFTPSPSRFSSHTWVEAGSNRLFKSSWEGMTMVNCFQMIQSLRKIARPSEFPDIAAWAMTEVPPPGSRTRLSSDSEAVSTAEYSMKVLISPITNPLSYPK